MKNSEISRVMRSKKQASDSYDRISRWYDWLAESSEGPLAKIGLQKLNTQTGETVLEIGCGTGNILLEMSSTAGASGKVYGMDLSRGMLSVVKEKIPNAKPSAQIVLEQSDAVHLPFASKTFDSVFMSFVLELFDTPEIPLVLAECQRVLKPGGRICVVSMSRSELENIPLRIYEWFHQQIPNYVDCRPIYVTKALQESGLEIMETQSEQMWGLPVEICLAKNMDNR